MWSTTHIPSGLFFITLSVIKGQRKRGDKKEIEKKLIPPLLINTHKAPLTYVDPMVSF
jgi:hypothetical protein